MLVSGFKSRGEYSAGEIDYYSYEEKSYVKLQDYSLVVVVMFLILGFTDMQGHFLKRDSAMRFLIFCTWR